MEDSWMLEPIVFVGVMTIVIGLFGVGVHAAGLWPATILALAIFFYARS